MNECPFCSRIAAGEILATAGRSVILLDAFPRSEGHCLIVPKKHVQEFFELDEDLVAEMMSLVFRAKEIMGQLHTPDGWNIRVNVGVAGGQSISHTHIHLVPRYDGQIINDIENL